MKSSKKTTKKKVEVNLDDDPLAGDMSYIFQQQGWERVKFELRPKNKTITLRISEQLLDAVKKEADKNGIDYQKFIRLTLEKILLKAS
jgi:predicted DNA binding CopG/RHH family protein